MDPGTRKNGVRLLLILAVVIGVASIVLDTRFDNLQSTSRESALRTDRQMRELELALARVPAAQAAYLATGQNPENRMQEVEDTLQTIGLAFARFRDQDLSLGARLHMDAAAGAFDVLVAADGRARDAVRDDARLVAADAVFLESAEALGILGAELAGARSAEQEATSVADAQASRLRLIANGTAMGLVLIFALVAGRLRLQPPASEASVKAQMLRDLPPPVRSPAATVAGSPAASAAAATARAAADRPEVPDAVVSAPPAPPAPAAPEPAPAPVAQPVVNLARAAELCTDLARVIDSRDVPGLLARSARVLDAKGVIIWVANDEGNRLEPLLTHGYPDRVIRHLGTLDASDDNVTSAAFRSRRPQQLEGNGSGPTSALAVPLMTASGCVGVLAAEVPQSHTDANAVAVARILAAQFATLIVPGSGAAPAQAAEA